MLCVIAELNDAANEKLAAVQKSAFSDGGDLKPLHGHITLATYIGDDENGLIRWCRALMDGMSSFAVRYEKIEVLEETSVIAAIPEHSDILDDLHRQIAEKFSSDLDHWTRSDCWYPHTTLFSGPAPDLHSICQKMTEAFVPFRAAVCRFEFSRVLEKGYEIVDCVELAEGSIFGMERIGQ